MDFSMSAIRAPLDVPQELRIEYTRKLFTITKASGRLMLYYLNGEP